jgi:signal transduction histidine kinase
MQPERMQSERMRPERMQPERMQSERMQHFHIVVGAAGMTLTVSLCVTAGYALASLLRLPGILTVFISSIAGLLFFGAVAAVVRAAFSRRFEQEMKESHNTTLNAFARLAQGDFSVILPVDDHTAHSEIARAFNDMVQKLGDIDAMRTDFISNASHEIQSPLTSIGGFAALLGGDLPDGERKKYAEIIETESKRLSRLSDNLMKLSSLDSATIIHADFRLDKQLQNIVLALEPQWIVKDLALEIDLDKITVNGDEALLSQVWTNLLHNAIKFTPRGGTISVSLGNGALQIADTGCGIPADELPHIFERFYKVDKARDRSLGGNGLGLSIVKKILDLHGWKIGVQSAEGSGTAFAIEIPEQFEQVLSLHSR